MKDTVRDFLEVSTEQTKKKVNTENEIQEQDKVKR